MTKTRITTDQPGYVTVERDDLLSGERIATTYFVSRRGDGGSGYVRIADEAGTYPQVCAGLSSRGDTLISTPETLAATIRRELRRAQRAERREFA